MVCISYVLCSIFLTNHPLVQIYSISIAALFLAAGSSATPTVAYPFNSQTPPLARYGQAYSYSIPQDTFSGASGTITYGGDDLPQWLSINNSTGALSGTPPSSDSSKGDQTLSFNLTATDSSGTAYDSCTLLLTDNAGPKINTDTNLTSVLQTAGSVAGGQSLVLSPGEAFSMTFPSDFFQTQTSRSILAYLGMSDSHTPLPNWITFDGTSKFSGTAPSVNSKIAPAESFQLLYGVSDYSGFISSSIPFNILVGAHQFSTNITTDEITVNAGTAFEYGIPLQKLTLDGKALALANISSVSLNTSISWLTLNQNNATITGTPPDTSDSETEHLTVTITDSYEDTVSYILDLAINSDSDNSTLFTSSSLDPVNATSGKYFQYSIEKFVNNKNAEINVSYDPTVSWLDYHTENYTFNGIPPSSFSGTTVTLTATTGSNSKREADDVIRLAKRATETAVFQIENYKEPVTSSSSSTPTSTSASKTSASATQTSGSSSTTAGASASSTASGTRTLSPISSKKTAILLGVLIPSLFLIAVFFLWCCFCNNRRKQSKKSAEDLGDGEKPQISGPILPVDPEKDIGTGPVYPVSPGSSSTDRDDYLVGEKGEWESPKRVSHYNFKKMDDEGVEYDQDDSYHGSEKTHAYSSSTDTTPEVPNMPNSGERVMDSKATAAAAAAVGGVAVASRYRTQQAMNEGKTGRAITSDGPTTAGNTTTTAAMGGRKGIPAYLTTPYSGADHSREAASKRVKPRNSWRQTDNSDKRWQEHESLGSVGTISTDELLTLRLVDRDSYGDANREPGARNTFMQPTKSTILTPRHSVQPSDASSGIIRQIGDHSRESSVAGSHSHSTSIESMSSGGDNVRTAPTAIGTLQSVDEHNEVHEMSSDENVHHVDMREPDSTYQYATSFAEPSEDDTSAYRTAESGEELEVDEHEDTSDDDIRAYRNSHGQLTWSQVQGAQQGHAYSSSEDEQATTRRDLNRQASSASTHDSRRDTVRLVDFTKARRGSGPSPPNTANQAQHPAPVPALPTEKSVSAELAFI